MALSAVEEAQTRDLIAQQAALLSLASSEATIISKLGATKKNITQVTAASVLADADLMFIRQGSTDKSTTAALVKAYIMTAFPSLVESDFKASVRIASTVNIAALSGLAAIDGVTPVANDRILLKDQTTGSQNGIYLAAAGSWTRATDADTGAELNSGAIVAVEEGSVNADTIWMLTNDGVTTIGTTPLTFARKDASAATVQGLYKNLKIDSIGINNYNCIITADQVVLATSLGQYLSVSAVNKTVNANGTVGAPLSIMSARAASTWYYRWLWYNATLGLTATLDTSSTAPTAPAGYASTDYKALLPGASRTDASGSTYLLQISTRGKESQYIVLAASNTPNLRALATGASGNVTTPAYIALAIGAFTPPNAIKLNGLLFSPTGVVSIAAPNLSFSGYTSDTNTPPIVVTGNNAGEFSFFIESANIYWATNGASTIYCSGWIDN